MKNRTIYQTPVEKLLTLGDCHKITNEYNYTAELGLDTEHIPDLIRMAVDQKLNSADSGSLEFWGPIHAWRALGQLGAEVAIEPLIQLFHELEDSDWVNEEMPKVYGMFGEVAIPRLQAYLADESHGIFPRVTAIHSLEEICKQHHHAYQKCVAVLTQQLKLFAQNPQELNGFLVASLMELKATESATVIKSAFLGKSVPDEITGTWEDVCKILGINSDEIVLFPDINLDEVSQIDNTSVDDVTQTENISQTQDIVAREELLIEDTSVDDVTQTENISQTQDIVAKEELLIEDTAVDEKLSENTTEEVKKQIAITSDDIQLIEDVRTDVEELQKVEHQVDEQKQNKDTNNCETEANQFNSELDNTVVNESVEQSSSKGFGGFAISQDKAKTKKKKKR